MVLGQGSRICYLDRCSRLVGLEQNPQRAFAAVAGRGVAEGRDYHPGQTNALERVSDGLLVNVADDVTDDHHDYHPNALQMLRYLAEMSSPIP